MSEEARRGNREESARQKRERVGGEGRREGGRMLILWKDIKFTLLCPAQQEQEGKRKLINKGATFTPFTNLDPNKINSVFVCKREREEGGKTRKERERGRG